MLLGDKLSLGTIDNGLKSNLVSCNDVTKKTHSPILSLVAGGVAGCVAKTVSAPLDRVKILFQVSPRPFSLRLAGLEIISIFNTEGITALWRGNSATVFR